MTNDSIKRLDNYLQAIRNRIRPASDVPAISWESEIEIFSRIHNIPIRERVKISRPTEEMIAGLQEVHLTWEAIGEQDLIKSFS